MQNLAAHGDDANKAAVDVHWMFRLIPILTGYGVLALIGYLFIKWVQRRVKGLIFILNLIKILKMTQKMLFLK